MPKIPDIAITYLDEDLKAVVVGGTIDALTAHAIQQTKTLKKMLREMTEAADRLRILEDRSRN